MYCVHQKILMVFIDLDKLKIKKKDYKQIQNCIIVQYTQCIEDIKKKIFLHSVKINLMFNKKNNK